MLIGGLSAVSVALVPEEVAQDQQAVTSQVAVLAVDGLLIGRAGLLDMTLLERIWPSTCRHTRPPRGARVDSLLARQAYCCNPGVHSRCDQVG